MLTDEERHPLTSFTTAGTSLARSTDRHVYLNADAVEGELNGSDLTISDEVNSPTLHRLEFVEAGLEATISIKSST